MKFQKLGDMGYDQIPASRSCDACAARWEYIESVLRRARNAVLRVLRFGYSG
jgi:hypothetical protein